MQDDSQALGKRTELPVAVIVGSPHGESRGDQRRWEVAGVVVGERFAADSVSASLMRSGPDGELHMWRGLRLRLAKSEAEDYAINLSSDAPVVYVVVRFDPTEGLVPVDVTLSLGEAQAMDATDLRSVNESVRTTPMPPEVALWLQEFTVQHYVPRKKKKRGKQRSAAVYDAEVGDWAGDDKLLGGRK